MKEVTQISHVHQVFHDSQVAHIVSGLDGAATTDYAARRSLPNDEVPITSQLRSGVALLFRAYAYACDVERSLWDFAVEIHELRAVGLSNLDFRWLTCKGYVQHGREVTRDGETVRRINRDRGLNFTSTTCFVLTHEGVRRARRLAEPPVVTPPLQASREELFRQVEASVVVPAWDPSRQQLCFRGLLVKEFKCSSPNQEAVLNAFEEEGWPRRIDDPLTPTPQLEPKERLRNTIKSLNRNQRSRIIRFTGDGSGQAVRWESTSVPEARPTHICSSS